MRFPFPIIALAFIALCSAAPFTVRDVEDEDFQQNLRALVGRVAGEKAASKFFFERIPSDVAGNDVFELEQGPDNTIIVRANNGVSGASGFYHYIKNFCNSIVTWGSSTVTLPSTLPSISEHIRVVSVVRLRYAWNVCTFGYTAAFWDWNRWETELDWLALHGYNMPLAFVGQEYVWRELYRSIGATQEELDRFFSGPAFLAWQRMGNMRGWGGPLPNDWIDAQAELQKKILARARSLNMTPVLAGFAGHVPEAIKRIYPDAKVLRSAPWGRFEEKYTQDYLLEPTDPLFKTLGAKFYQIMNDTFGSDHFFNADTYNEMDPSSRDPTFLANSNKAIYDAMSAVDPEAIFVMQGWLFHFSFWGYNDIKAFLSAIPDDKMIMLDLNSETGPVWSATDNYFGKQWIWNMLSNFGGVRAIYGNLDLIAVEPLRALNMSKGTMVGLGITPEAIESNPVVFELMSEMTWRHEPVSDVDEWVQTYAQRRYGKVSPYASAAWKELRTSAYRTFSYSRSPMIAGPELKMDMVRNSNATGMQRASYLLLQAAKNNELPMTESLRYDILDFTRQAIADSFYDLSALLEAVFERYEYYGENTTVSVQAIANEILSIIHDEDEMLRTDSNFLFGKWVEAARAAGSKGEKNLFEFNARNIVTMWGPNENIEDYASKEWAGLVEDYYGHRWKIFLSHLIESVRSGVRYDGAKYESDRLAFEQEWSNETKPFSTTAEGDIVVIASAIQDKYFGENKAVLYTEADDTDVDGNDILLRGPAWMLNIDHLKRLCNLYTECAGFTADGYLKSSVGTTRTVEGQKLYKKVRKY